MYVVVMGFYIVVVMMMSVLMVAIGLSFVKGEGVESTYECGFDSSFMVRSAFSYRFFLIAVIFMVFDVEITLMLPVPYLCFSYYSVVLLIMFMSVLVGGLVYEIWWGSLDWL